MSQNFRPAWLRKLRIIWLEHAGASSYRGALERHWQRRYGGPLCLDDALDHYEGRNGSAWLFPGGRVVKQIRQRTHGESWQAYTLLAVPADSSETARIPRWLRRLDGRVRRCFLEERPWQCNLMGPESGAHPCWNLAYYPLPVEVEGGSQDGELAKLASHVVMRPLLLKRLRIQWLAVSTRMQAVYNDHKIIAPVMCLSAVYAGRPVELAFFLNPPAMDAASLLDSQTGLIRWKPEPEE